MAGFPVEVLGLALVAKMCPAQPRALKSVNDSQASPWQKKKKTHFFFLERAGSSTPCESFAQLSEGSTA